MRYVRNEHLSDALERTSRARLLLQRQLEIYHLIPNTTYEFRIWGNNQLGAGEIVTILSTTQPRMEEKDLVRRIMIDAKNFDTRVWIAAVGIVMGTLVILSLGTCIVLYKECREPAGSTNDFSHRC
ncbi:AGAP013210-PA-like protein [Anopheles sinensis]|uniref:AGAP013210-PA-like protein n=1 Tax=Anopheles sinensis TaxID=74873 RepID=A0A084WF64_ANOSI|nr:AGAP013210-PA-like protein [Anopheles sinensis]